MNRPTLEQSLASYEYAIARGIKTLDRADDVLDSMFASGDVVPGERPRIVTYYSGMQRRYAIAAADITDFV